MLRIKIWVLLPLLTLSMSLAGFLFFSNILVETLEDGVVAQIERACDALANARQAVSDRHAALTVDLAETLANSDEFADLAGGREQAKKGKKEPRPSVAEMLRAAREPITKRLEEIAAAKKTGYLALLDAKGEPVASFPEDGTMAGLCAESNMTKGALEGRPGAYYDVVKDALYSTGAAPVKDGDEIVGVVCAIRQVDDGTAEVLRSIAGFDVSIFLGKHLVGSTLRQRNPELLKELSQKKTSIVKQGALQGRNAPILVKVPAFLSSMFSVAVREPEVRVSLAVTAQVESAVKDLRNPQMVFLLVSALTFLLSLAIAWSIQNTLRRSTEVITQSLGSAAKGNLQVNIPVGSLERPFSTIGESVNRTLFAIRERSPLFQGQQAKKKEIGGILGAGPAGTPPSGETRSPTTGERPKPVSAVRAAAPIEPAPVIPERPASLTGEIQVTQDMDDAAPAPPPPSGELPAQITSRDYNPDATVVAAVPSEFMEQVDREMEAMRAAKAAAHADPFAAVYAEFLQTRLRCGEKVENLAQDRFIEKLKKNRDEIIAKTGCRDVRFSVVVKDGKASIKASPVR